MVIDMAVLTSELLGELKAKVIRWESYFKDESATFQFLECSHENIPLSQYFGTSWKHIYVRASQVIWE